VNRPADLVAIYDAISAWTDCGYISSCGIWGERDIPATLAKLGQPTHPRMKDPRKDSAGWVKNYVSRVAPHADNVNYMYADGHVKASRWDRLKWGNLNGNIPDSDPDYNVPLTTLRNPGDRRAMTFRSATGHSSDNGSDEERPACPSRR